MGIRCFRRMEPNALLTQRLAMIGLIKQHGFAVSQTIDHLREEIVGIENRVVVGIDHLLLRARGNHLALHDGLKLCVIVREVGIIPPM